MIEVVNLRLGQLLESIRRQWKVGHKYEAFWLFWVVAPYRHLCNCWPKPLGVPTMVQPPTTMLSFIKFAESI